LGEARARRRAHAQLLSSSPWCIYCGGSQPADTIEHMPPVMMFIRKQRPKGLEFPSCRECNNGTSKSDLVASLLGRLSVHPSADDEAAETRSCSPLFETMCRACLKKCTSTQRRRNLCAKAYHYRRATGLCARTGHWLPNICSSSVPSWALRCTTKHYRLSCRQRVVCSHCGFLTRRLREEKYRRAYFRCFQPHGRR